MMRLLFQKKYNNVQGCSRNCQRMVQVFNKKIMAVLKMEHFVMELLI